MTQKVTVLVEQWKLDYPIMVAGPVKIGSVRDKQVVAANNAKGRDGVDRAVEFISVAIRTGAAIEAGGCSAIKVLVGERQGIVGAV